MQPKGSSVRRKGMTEGMAGGRAADFGFPNGLLHRALHHRFVQVMTPLDL